MGSSGAEGGMQARSSSVSNTPVVEERGGGGRGRWTMRAGGRLISAVPAIPMEGVVAGFPNKGGISVVLLCCSSWSIRGPAPWDCCFLLEVAVRVWCRVAAGSEVVVEVLFEASELRGVLVSFVSRTDLQICMGCLQGALTMLRSSTTPSLTHTLCAPIMFAIIMSVNRRSPTIATCSGLVT